MNASSPPDVGTVVYSRAGRDAGRYFVVLEVLDDQYVLIADGDLRKIANPKKKKLKHLDIKMVSIPIVKERMREKGRLFDYDIRQNLGALGLGPDKDGQEK